MHVTAYVDAPHGLVKLSCWPIWGKKSPSAESNFCYYILEQKQKERERVNTVDCRTT